MRTIPLFFVALFFSGCLATPPPPPQRAVTITTIPVDAHVQLISDNKVIAEGDTVGREIRFSLAQPGHVSVEIKASAPGYLDGFGFIAWYDAAKDVQLNATTGTMRANIAQAAAEDDARIKGRRASFIAAHPELTKAQREDVAAGHLFAGMTTEAVTASWGKPTGRTVQGGLGGDEEIWRYHQTDTLFFFSGILVRWSLDR